MLIGYARVSKSDGTQLLDLQLDGLQKHGVKSEQIYSDHASGKNSDRPGLAACLKSLRPNDILVIWKLDRLGRDLKHLVNTVSDLSKNGIGLKVITGHGVGLDTTSSGGKLMFGIFAALAEFERDLISERTKAGLKAARARGRKGGRKFLMSKSQIRLAQAAIGKKETHIGDLCKELKISRTTLYRYVSPDGILRKHAEEVLGSQS